jgi:hypothetical protein
MSSGRPTSSPETDGYEVYPPNDWAPRSPPTADEIESAFEKAHSWWPYAVGPRGDDFADFLECFERYLSGNVRRRETTPSIPTSDANSRHKSTQTTLTDRK